MNLFLREIKINFKPLLFWSIGLALFIVLGMQDYIASTSSEQSLPEIIDAMPKIIRAFLGVGSFNVGTIDGYYGMLYMYILLVAGLHAGMLGSNIIAKEERDKTAEFLYVKPISRNRIITMKFLASIVNIVIINMVAFISSTLVTINNENVNMLAHIANLMIGLFFFQLIFLSLGIFSSSVIKKSDKSRMITSVIFFATFLISIAVDLSEKLSFLKFLTPFKYFDAYNVMYGTGFELVFILLTTILIFGFMAFTFRTYKKREFNI